MTDSQARFERQSGAARLLWSNRGRILASAAALGLAAFLAGSLVPASHRASIRLAAPPAISTQWTEAVLQDVLSKAPPEAEQSRLGVLAAWADLIDQTSALRPDIGSERAADGSLVIWVEDRDADGARRRAQTLANDLIDRSKSMQATAIAPSPQTRPAIPELDESIAKARDALSAAQARLVEAEASDPPSGDTDAERGSSLDADRRAAQDARRVLQSAEAFAGGLAKAAPSDAPADIRDGEAWIGWRDAVARRDAVAAQVADLSRTLLDGHPRMAMVRLRLADLEEDVTAARARLDDALQRRIAGLRGTVDRLDRRARAAAATDNEQETARARVAGAIAEVDAARRTVGSLEEARRVAEGTGEGEPRPATPAGSAPPVVSTSLTETEQRPRIWPIVAGSAGFGFLAASLYSILGGLRRRPASVPRERAVRNVRRGGAWPDARIATERRSSGADLDIIPADELIGGILASEISRVVIVPIGADERPAAVEIVRRLALRGRQGALVDLSERQLAARAMGVPPEALGISDMIAGDATFAEIARRDFATQAEAFGAGRTTIGEAAFLAMERRNVLEFIERNYEVALVVCGGLPLATVKALLTPDAALVVTVEGEEEAGIADGVRRLRAAGLADMILADGRQLASQGS